MGESSGYSSSWHRFGLCLGIMALTSCSASPKELTPTATLPPFRSKELTPTAALPPFRSISRTYGQVESTDGRLLRINLGRKNHVPQAMNCLIHRGDVLIGAGRIVEKHSTWSILQWTHGAKTLGPRKGDRLRWIEFRDLKAEAHMSKVVLPAMTESAQLFGSAEKLVMEMMTNTEEIARSDWLKLTSAHTEIFLAGLSLAEFTRTYNPSMGPGCIKHGYSRFSPSHAADLSQGIKNLNQVRGILAKNLPKDSKISAKRLDQIANRLAKLEPMVQLDSQDKEK